MGIKKPKLQTEGKCRAVTIFDAGQVSSRSMNQQINILPPFVKENSKRQQNETIYIRLRNLTWFLQGTPLENSLLYKITTVNSSGCTDVHLFRAFLSTDGLAFGPPLGMFYF